MSGGAVLLWVIMPYVAITTFVVGHVWRYRNDQFAWTSRSTQLLDRRVLGWASPAFHFGALAAIGGHVIGILIPESLTNAVGIPESAYRWIAGIAGGIAGIVVTVGLFGLLYRRARSERVRQTTTRLDMVTYILLTALILMGTWMTFRHTLITDAPYNYRHSISEWWRSLLYFDPDVQAATGAMFIYQLHAIVAWAFWAIFPFSRLVHAWSFPLQYLGRPYILYRRRYPTPALTRRD